MHERQCLGNITSFALGVQILVTELGDETFIIAAIMAMRHGKAIVYAGAMSALGFMTVLLALPCSKLHGIRVYASAGCLSNHEVLTHKLGPLQIISTALGYILPNLISRCGLVLTVFNSCWTRLMY